MKNRFAEALAICDSENDAIKSHYLWALYKLGCYRSASSFAAPCRSGREAIALGISLAASGNIDAASTLLRQAHSDGLIREQLVPEAARLIAPFCIETALHLAESSSITTLGLRASLFIAVGRSQEALVLLNKALESGGDAKDRDLFLLKINALGNQVDSLDLVNSYLEAHGLSPISRRDGLAPLSATNIVANPPTNIVRGPLVTVIMPAYNTSSRIGAAIESLTAQTYRDIEILIVDDASTDDTVAVARSFAERDSRIRLIERRENGGPYLARNLALVNASGDFVTCHDSDDWAHPEKIFRQLEPLLKDSRLAFTLSNWVRIQDDGFLYARSIYPLTRLNPASPLFRKDLILKQAGFYENARTGADSEYTARLKLIFGRRRWKNVHLPLAFGAHRAGSLMTDSKTGNVRGFGMNPQRLDYWEAWTKRHIESLRRRRNLYRHFDNISSLISP